MGDSEAEGERDPSEYRRQSCGDRDARDGSGQQVTRSRACLHG
jgi:hypothetical protein